MSIVRFFLGVVGSSFSVLLGLFCLVLWCCERSGAERSEAERSGECLKLGLQLER